MLNTIFSLKKNSYQFTDQERAVLLMLIDFFKYEIPKGNGSYIAMLDFSNIDFIWCPSMALNDMGVFGSWSPLSENLVCLRPDVTSKTFFNLIKDESRFSKKEREAIHTIKDNVKITGLPQFKNLGSDLSIFQFILYLTENKGAVLATVFHELYHKWQYESVKLFYLMNSFLVKLVGYELSTKSGLTIEGDVRIYVDNEEFHEVIEEFNRMLYNYLYNKNVLATNPENENAVNEITALQNRNFRMFQFIEKLFRSLN